MKQRAREPRKKRTANQPQGEGGDQGAKGGCGSALEASEGDGSHAASVQISVEAVLEAGAPSATDSLCSSLACGVSGGDSSIQLLGAAQSAGKKKGTPSFPFFTYTLVKETFRSDGPSAGGRILHSQVHQINVDDAMAKAISAPVPFVFYYADPAASRVAGSQSQGDLLQLQQAAQGAPQGNAGNVAVAGGGGGAPAIPAQAGQGQTALQGQGGQGGGMDPQAMTIALQKRPSAASLGLPSFFKGVAGKKKDAPFVLMVDMSCLLSDAALSLHLVAEGPADPELPPRFSEVHISAAVVSPPLLSPLQQKRFNPLSLRLCSAVKLPLHGQPSFAVLDKEYRRVYARYKFLGSPGWVSSPKRTHSEKVKWSFTKTFLAATFDQEALAEYLETTPLVVELHDRDPHPHPCAPPTSRQTSRGDKRKEALAGGAAATTSAAAGPASQGGQQQAASMVASLAASTGDLDKLPSLKKPPSRRARKGRVAGSPGSPELQEGGSSGDQHLPSLTKPESSGNSSLVSRVETPLSGTLPPSVPGTAPAPTEGAVTPLPLASAPGTAELSKRAPSRRRRIRESTPADSGSGTTETNPSNVPAGVPSTSPSSAAAGESVAAGGGAAMSARKTSDVQAAVYCGVAKFSLRDLINGDTDFKATAQLLPQRSEDVKSSCSVPGRQPVYLENGSQLSLVAKLHAPLRVPQDASKFGRAVFVLGSNEDSNMLAQLIDDVNREVVQQHQQQLLQAAQQTVIGCTPPPGSPVASGVPAAPAGVPPPAPAGEVAPQTLGDQRPVSCRCLGGVCVTDGCEVWVYVLEGLAEFGMTLLDASIPPSWRPQSAPAEQAIQQPSATSPDVQDAGDGGDDSQESGSPSRPPAPRRSVALSNPRLRFRRLLYREEDSKETGVGLKVALSSPLRRLLMSSHSRRWPREDEDTLQLLGRLCESRRLFEAKLFNLFPANPALESLQQRTSSVDPELPK